MNDSISEDDIQFPNTPPEIFASDLLSEEATDRIENEYGLSKRTIIKNIGLEGTGEAMREGTFGAPLESPKIKETTLGLETLRAELERLSVENLKHKISNDIDNNRLGGDMVSSVHFNDTEDKEVLSDKMSLVHAKAEKFIKLEDLKNTLTQIELLKAQKTKLEEDLARNSERYSLKVKKHSQQQMEIEKKLSVVMEELEEEKQRTKRQQMEIEELKLRLTHLKEKKVTESLVDPISSALKEAFNKHKNSFSLKPSDGLIIENEKLKEELAYLNNVIIKQRNEYEAALRDVNTRVTHKNTSHNKSFTLPTSTLTTGLSKQLRRVLESIEGCTLLKLCCILSNTKLNIIEHKSHSKNMLTDIISILNSMEEPFKDIGEEVIRLNRLLLMEGITKRKLIDTINGIKEMALIEIDHLLGVKNTPRIRKQEVEEDEEQYWSDFSDENYEQENKDETDAIDAITLLKQWVHTEDYDINKKGTISMEELKEVLVKGKCPCSKSMLCALIRKLDVNKRGEINYTDFIRRLREESITLWKEYIYNNSIEQKKRVSRKGNIASLACPGMYSFIKLSIIQKLKVHPNSHVKEIKSKEGISRSELRRLFLNMKLPLNREDIRVLFNELDKNKRGKVSPDKVNTFLANPQSLFQLSDIYKKLHQHINLSLSLQNNKKLTYDDFKQLITTLKVPLNLNEIELVFNELKDKNDVLDYNTLVKCVTHYTDSAKQNNKIDEEKTLMRSKMNILVIPKRNVNDRYMVLDHIEDNKQNKENTNPEAIKPSKRETLIMRLKRSSKL